MAFASTCLRCTKCTHVTAKSQHFHACENRYCTCVHLESLIASFIAKVELGSTPAICLATALRQCNGKHFRSESLDRVARRASHHASRRRSDIAHQALHVGEEDFYVTILLSRFPGMIFGTAPVLPLDHNHVMKHWWFFMASCNSIPH